MLHLPVSKWGRAFLERGLIEARFVKPVYDGETADVTGEESDGGLAIRVESRGQLCATGSASLPASAPAVSISDFSETAAVTERKAGQCDVISTRQVARHHSRAWAGDAAKEYLTDVRETDAIYASEGLGHQALGHPGLLQRVMNKVLVDNAILGPWIHVGSRMPVNPGACRSHRPLLKALRSCIRLPTWIHGPRMAFVDQHLVHDPLQQAGMAKCLMAKSFAGVNRIGLAHVRQIFFCRIAGPGAAGMVPSHLPS